MLERKQTNDGSKETLRFKKCQTVLMERVADKCIAIPIRS